jgi:RHS repeat-associated protein
MPTFTTTYVIGNGNNGAGANQIASETTSGVTTTYAYDGNGNRTGRTISGTTDVFSYDYENRLTSLDYLTGGSGTGMYTYTYDYRTRRVSRTEPSAGTTYIVFDGGVSIIEYGAAGAANPSAEYVRGFNYGGGVGGLEYSVRGGVPSFNFFDSRGDVTTKTDATGAVTWETAYEAFGNETVSTGTTPADRQRASTKEQDPTGFLNEGFRYRDLSTGMFLTRDPLGFKAGLNNYTYVRQNPWTHFDPEGLIPLPPPQNLPQPIQVETTRPVAKTTSSPTPTPVTPAPSGMAQSQTPPVQAAPAPAEKQPPLPNPTFPSPAVNPVANTIGSFFNPPSDIPSWVPTGSVPSAPSATPPAGVHPGYHSGPTVQGAAAGGGISGNIGVTKGGSGLQGVANPVGTAGGTVNIASGQAGSLSVAATAGQPLTKVANGPALNLRLTGTAYGTAQVKAGVTLTPGSAPSANGSASVQIAPNVTFSLGGAVDSNGKKTIGASIQIQTQ